MLQFLIEFFDRLRTESPEFFKKIQWVAGIVFTIASALKVVIDNDILSFGAEEQVTKFLGYVIAFISAVFITAKAAVKDVVGGRPKERE